MGIRTKNLWFTVLNVSKDEKQNRKRVSAIGIACTNYQMVYVEDCLAAEEA